MIGCIFSLRGYRVLRKVEGRLVLVPAALFFVHQDIWNVYFLLRFFPRESQLTVRPSFSLNVFPP